MVVVVVGALVVVVVGALVMVVVVVVVVGALVVVGAFATEAGTTDSGRGDRRRAGANTRYTGF